MHSIDPGAELQETTRKNIKQQIHMYMYVAFVTLSKEINCQHVMYCYVQKLYYMTSHMVFVGFWSLS